MRDIFDNGMILVVLVTLVVVILGVFGWLKFRRDERIVMEFLKNSGVEPRDDFTTTTAISSATSLSEARIRRVCGKSARIIRHREDSESWKLDQESEKSKVSMRSER
jgi:hypothetical protein